MHINKNTFIYNCNHSKCPRNGARGWRGVCSRRSRGPTPRRARRPRAPPPRPRPQRLQSQRPRRLPAIGPSRAPWPAASFRPVTSMCRGHHPPEGGAGGTPIINDHLPVPYSALSHLTKKHIRMTVSIVETLPQGSIVKLFRGPKLKPKNNCQGNRLSSLGCRKMQMHWSHWCSTQYEQP